MFRKNELQSFHVDRITMLSVMWWIDHRVMFALGVAHYIATLLEYVKCLYNLGVCANERDWVIKTFGQRVNSD